MDAIATIVFLVWIRTITTLSHVFSDLLFDCGFCCLRDGWFVNAPWFAAPLSQKPCPNVPALGDLFLKQTLVLNIIKS